MLLAENTELSPREYVLMESQKEEARLAREHAVTIKQLELATVQEKNAAEIELKKLEAKWSSLLKIPATIIKLPIYAVLSVGYIVYAIRGTEPGKSFWQLIK